MSKQPKRPSFQFYPGDWLNDAALRLVSVGARGLWIDMLCMMHQGTPYGHLKVAGKVILPSNLARTLGATLPEYAWCRAYAERTDKTRLIEKPKRLLQRRAF